MSNFVLLAGYGEQRCHTQSHPEIDVKFRTILFPSVKMFYPKNQQIPARHVLDVHPEGDPGDNDEEDGGNVGLNLNWEYSGESESIIAMDWSHFHEIR